MSRRTAFIRYNGLKDSVPSFSILSNRCVHLGCPTQPQGPPGEPREVETDAGPVELTPTQPSGLRLPLPRRRLRRRGQPDGRAARCARSTATSTRSSSGSLVLGSPYSVAEVEGEGADAVIVKYDPADPGVHVDGPEQYFYPYVP